MSLHQMDKLSTFLFLLIFGILYIYIILNPLRPIIKKIMKSDEKPSSNILVPISAVIILLLFPIIFSIYNKIDFTAFFALMIFMIIKEIVKIENQIKIEKQIKKFLGSCKDKFGVNNGIDIGCIIFDIITNVFGKLHNILDNSNEISYITEEGKLISTQRDKVILIMTPEEYQNHCNLKKQLYFELNMNKCNPVSEDKLSNFANSVLNKSVKHKKRNSMNK